MNNHPSTRRCPKPVAQRGQLNGIEDIMGSVPEDKRRLPISLLHISTCGEESPVALRRVERCLESILPVPSSIHSDGVM